MGMVGPPGLEPGGLIMMQLARSTDSNDLRLLRILQNSHQARLYSKYSAGSCVATGTNLGRDGLLLMWLKECRNFMTNVNRSESTDWPDLPFVDWSDTVSTRGFNFEVQRLAKFWY